MIGVALAGGVGAWLRGELEVYGRRREWRRGRATLVVNVLGSFALGLAVGAWGLGGVPESLSVGFLGGFTTFSTWMAEAIDRQRGGNVRLLGGLVATMAVLGIAGAALGQWLGSLT